MSAHLGLILLQDGGQSGPAGGLLTFVPFIAVILIFYFLVLRPQNRERKRIEDETKAMLAALKTGDKVVTTGGIYGTIRSVRDDTVQLQIADAVKIEVLRSSIARAQAESGAEGKS